MRQILLIILLLFPLFAKAQNTPHERYVEKYKNVAVQEMKRSGVPASIKLAQGLLESKYGESELALHANNHFGIKCKESWAGQTYSLEDDDFENGILIKSCFRKYPNVLASYRDHTDFLRSRPWYAPLFELNERDYKSWAYGLKEAGYATDSLYPQKLISRIEQWGLSRYDNEKPLESIREIPLATLPLPAQTVSSVNGVKYFTARQGQTPVGIAKRTEVSLKEILEYNEEISQPNQTLYEGERVFLQKKKRKYKRGKSFHRAGGSEDLYQIAQLYGVRLKRLAKRNRMAQNGVPYRGEIIKLRGFRVKKSKAPNWRFELKLPAPREDYKKDGVIYHTIVRGETLYSLARKYQTSVGRLRVFNNLKSDNLKIGEVLKIR